MKIFLLTVALFGAVASATTEQEDEVELPDYVQTCDQDDPERDVCIKNAIQDMLPRVHKGIKSLNIPPMDPYLIETNRFDYKNGAIQGSLALKGVKVYGFSRAQVKEVRTKITEDGMSAEFDIFVPRIFIEGTYKANVNLNDLKLNPRGYFNVSMNDINTTQKLGGVFETIKGKRHLKMTTFDMDPEVGSMKFYATGLFPDPQLNAFILDFVNQNWPEMYKMMLPQTRQYWEPLALGAMNEFLGRVPFEKMLTKKQV